MNAKLPFLEKNYYSQVVLSNGTDFCPIDFTGSMAFKAQIKGLASYWYRKGRPNVEDPLGIVQLRWKYISDFGPVEIGDFEQNFDPTAAIVKTRVVGYQFKFDIETFLTDDHTLVEIFTVLKSDAKKGQLDFPVMFGGYSYTNKVTKVLYDAPQGKVTIRREKIQDETVEFDYSWKDNQQAFQGIGKISVKIISGSGVIANNITDSDKEHNYYSGLSVSNITAGDVIIRVTTLMDSLDGPAWEARLATNHENALNVISEKQQHIEVWQKRIGSSSLSCIDSDMARAFEVSKYVCSASLHSNGSSVSALGLPNDHGMGTYWDVWYVHQGLLVSNCISSAEKIINFWKIAAKNGRRAAAAMNAEGIRFPWTLDFEGNAMFGDHPQLHNNAIPAITIWNQYEYTRDTSILHDNFDLMREALRFISSYALREDEQGEPYLRELIPVDENPKHKKNELTTVVVFLRGVEILRKTAAIIGKKLDEQIMAEQVAFQTILDELKDGDSWRIYEGGNAGGWSTFITHIHLPKPGKLEKSFSAALDFCAEPYGLGPGKTSRMRCATWPWLDGIAAWSMAKNLDQRAICRLEHMLQVCNFHGGIPEYVWIHGEPSREWFLGAHGAFLAGFVEILVQREANRLQFFPLGYNIPWLHALNLQQIRLPGALLISLDCRTSGKCRVIIENKSDENQTLTVNAGGVAIEKTTIQGNGRQEILLKMPQGD